MRTHKPPVSGWIVTERKRRQWKVEELSRRLTDMGYAASVSTVRVWEAGRTPAPETLEALERLFESPAPRDQEPQTDTAALVAAIDRQTQAIGALVEAIREDRDRLSPEAVRIFLSQLVAEGLLARPEGLAIDSEPQPQVSDHGQRQAARRAT